MTLIKRIFSFATLLLLVAVSLSSIAAWYSIQGLVAIFAAAVIPIMIMGGSLEFAKVLTTVWLHRFWKRADWKIKVYLTACVIGLALLTSMGIFGFLSRAHSDQALMSGDVQAKIAVYDTKIQTAKDTIAEDRKSLQQLDAAVDQVMSRSTDVNGAEKSSSIRKSQAKERTRLNKEIQDSQAEISKINDDAAPVRAQIRKVEADVGPIKYIAALIYGDNPSADLLERAVRWVIILIVFVFDPLALTLVIAATATYKWMDEDSKLGFEDHAVPKIIKEKENVADLQTNYVNLDGEVRENLPEESTTYTNEPMVLLDKSENTPEEEVETISADTDITIDQIETNHSIQTTGVTFNKLNEDYVEFKGKSTHKNALAIMHPELFAIRADDTAVNTNFGSTFPKIAAKGDIFVRVDVLPNRVYKFDGVRWIEVNKELSDSYLYDDEYIKHLVQKIETGEYDIELLSDNEKIQIENYLKKNNA